MTKVINHVNENNIFVYKKVLDIGAYDGKFLSNSYPLITENNFYGILVEPNPASYSKIYENLNGYQFEAHNIGLSNINTRIKLNIVENDPTLGSLHKQSKNQISIQLMDFRMFECIVDLSNIGIMSIDTEGHDVIVINRMLCYTKVRPQIIITESWPQNKSMNKLKENFLNNNGYKKFLQVEENSCYIK